MKPGVKALPDVTNKSVAAAETILTKQGWTNFQTKTIASLTVQPNNVVRTNPVAGTKWPSSQPVVLYVSGGGKAVPYLLFKTRQDAINALQAAGLVPNVVVQAGPGSAQPGTVWQSIPAANKVVLPGSTVTIYVVPTAASPTPTSPSPTPSATGSPTPTGSP